MIVTLAGHVDHGKTSLVRALSGVNTDRLAEEQKRGLTIDLGFAYIDSGNIGFVDVPGHQKFIHNMVAGIAANQYAMLVIAADDGPMPQSHEHLDILSLTGLAQGCVVITKADRVTDERLQQCRAEIDRLLQHTFLQDSTRFVTSIEDPGSFDALLTHLRSKADDYQRQQQQRPFRLAIDRTFSVKGSGVVITGTAHSGCVSVDEHLHHFPSGELVRIRGIRTQDQESNQAQSGERCALNISGLELTQLQRGDWLSATPPAGYRTLSLDLQISKDFPRSVKHWTPVHVYHATHHTQARLALAPGQRLEPGQTGRVDLILDEALHCHRGDRLILRDHSLDTTLGGGQVIYAEAQSQRRRQAPYRQQKIDAYALHSADACLNELLKSGVTDIAHLQGFWHLTDADRKALVSKHTVKAFGDLLLSDTHWQQHKAATLQQFNDQPNQPLRENELHSKLPRSFLQTLLNELVQEQHLTQVGGEYRVVGEEVQVPAHLSKLWESLHPALCHKQAPSTGDLAKRFNTPQSNLERDMNELVKSGLLVNVASHRYYLPEQLHEIAKIVMDMTATAPLTVKAFRDKTGIGRNVAIEVLEYFDSKGFTRRQGNDRIVLNANMFS